MVDFFAHISSQTVHNMLIGICILEYIFCSVLSGLLADCWCIGLSSIVWKTDQTDPNIRFENCSTLECAEKHEGSGKSHRSSCEQMEAFC